MDDNWNFQSQSDVFGHPIDFNNTSLLSTSNTSFISTKHEYHQKLDEKQKISAGVIWSKKWISKKSQGIHGNLIGNLKIQIVMNQKRINNKKNLAHIQHFPLCEYYIDYMKTLYSIHTVNAQAEAVIDSFQ